VLETLLLGAGGVAGVCVCGVAVYSRVLPCVAVCCRVLPCVAVSCRVLELM